MFAGLARALAVAGVASLRVDERGTGASSGRPWPFQTTSSRVGDVAAALDFLRGRPEIDATRVDALGHSEGAEIVAALGAERPLAFAILLSAPALPNRETFLAQEMGMFAQRASDVAGRASYQAALERLIGRAVDSSTRADAFDAGATDLLVAAGQPADNVNPRAVQGIAGTYQSPWLREQLTEIIHWCEADRPWQRR